MASCNDSSQIRDLMRHDDIDIGQGEVSQGQIGATNSTEQACSSYSTSSGKRESERDREREREEPEPERGRKMSVPCCSLSELKRVPQCQETLEPLNFSDTHTVLIDVSLFNNEGIHKAQEGRSLWHRNFVKMPCSPESLITKTGLFKLDSHVKRWDVISKELGGLAKKRAVSVEDVEKAIMGYNPKYKGQWSFDALNSFVKCIPEAENYFPTLFPKIAELALRLQHRVKKAIPLLQRGQTASITLSQVQIACLLANAFFCTFPQRNTADTRAEYHNYPTINFNSLFGEWSERKREKLRAIFYYFKVVTDDNRKPGGLVTFERHCLKDADIPKWRSRTEEMSKLHVTSEGLIGSEGTGMLQVDFACSLIGGGVLGQGLVQEEILFLTHPELIVSRLFTERLEDNECLIIKGPQQYNSSSGFSDSFEWAGPYEDPCRRDRWGRLHRQILAIDALNFKHKHDQYSMRKITRELNKAYCGFKAHGRGSPDIATGNWGCGAFNGDPQLKALIQLMAAAVAHRGVAFFTFGNGRQKEDLQQIHHLLTTQGTTVGMLYGALEDYCVKRPTARGTHVDLFHFIRSTLGDQRSQL